MSTSTYCFKCKRECNISVKDGRRYWKCGDEKCDCWNGWIDRSKNKLADKALENISGLLTAYKPLKKLCKKELYLKK